MFITNSKQVGIDKTPTSDFKLDVNGEINCKGINVNGNPFSSGLQAGDNISELNNNSGYITLSSGGNLTGYSMEIPNDSNLLFKKMVQAIQMPEFTMM